MHLQSSRLLCKEAVGIEPGQKDVTEDTAHPRLHKFEGLAFDHRRIDEIESERVGPVCIDDKSRIRIVFETLGHFFLPSAARTRPFTMRLLKAGLSNSAVEITINV
jgi:hypothetical protein